LLTNLPPPPISSPSQREGEDLESHHLYPPLPLGEDWRRKPSFFPPFIGEGSPPVSSPSLWEGRKKVGEGLFFIWLPN